jgi:hypothetical protein
MFGTKSQKDPISGLNDTHLDQVTVSVQGTSVLTDPVSGGIIRDLMAKLDRSQQEICLKNEKLGVLTTRVSFLEYEREQWNSLNSGRISPGLGVEPNFSSLHHKDEWATKRPWLASKYLPKTPLEKELMRILEEERRAREEERRAEEEKMRALVEELMSRAEEKNCFESRIKELEAKLAAPRATPNNSGTPPSKSYFKKRKAKSEEDSEDGSAPKKKQGGQKGHKGHWRTPFSSEDSERRIYDGGDDQKCEDCGTTLLRFPKGDQKRDLNELPNTEARKVIEEIYAYKCPKCNKVHHSKKPGGFEGGTLSPEIVAKMVALSSVYNMTERQIRDLLIDEHKIELCVATVDNNLKKASDALRPIYLEIQDLVKSTGKLNIDETSHPLKGTLFYNWVFCGKNVVFYSIGPRSKDTLVKVLGENWEGFITCDYFIVYRSFHKDHPGVIIQFCLVHLQRDFQYIAEYVGKEDFVIYGKTGVKLIQELIHEFHQYEEIEDKTSSSAILSRAKLSHIKESLISHALNPPENCDKGKAIAKRFEEFANFYFTFLDNPGISPSNNLAEISLRGPVINRKISYFSQSLKGIWFRETTWTIANTLKVRKENIQDFFTKALTSYFENNLLPSLANPGQFVDQKYVDAAKEQIKNRTQIEAAIMEWIESKKKKTKGQASGDKSSDSQSKAQAKKEDLDDLIKAYEGAPPVDFPRKDWGKEEGQNDQSRPYGGPKPDDSPAKDPAKKEGQSDQSKPSGGPKPDDSPAKDPAKKEEPKEPQPKAKGRVRKRKNSKNKANTIKPNRKSKATKAKPKKAKAKPSPTKKRKSPNSPSPKGSSGPSTASPSKSRGAKNKPAKTSRRSPQKAFADKTLYKASRGSQSGSKATGVPTNKNSQGGPNQRHTRRSATTLSKASGSPTRGPGAGLKSPHSFAGSSKPGPRNGATPTGKKAGLKGNPGTKAKARP